MSDFPGGSEVKASAWNAEDLGSIPGLGRSPGKGIHTCICITESLCCAPKTNKTLLMNYNPI